jgi:hypothetical protein
MKKQLVFIFFSFLFLIIITLSTTNSRTGNIQHIEKEFITKTGVCPPFFLYDEDGNVINPAKGINADKPYSTRQTCGKCHDYNKITEGFHFQQGKDEMAAGTFAERYQWVSTPGNYGGNWCSPAPLYRALAAKNNASAKDIDMTSFDFITATCGNCHPGGGPLEFDRNGNRYDRFMADNTNHLIAMGNNNFDGDYYKANWTATGVIEADCQLCHLPEYNYKERNNQLAKLNFKWAATQGSGLATVSGSVKDTIPVVVKYDLSKFDKEGKLSLHLVREPRNETCLNCHAKPDWKKKGTTYAARSDVHMNAGLRCVDCHTAGSMASNERISGKEVHQFGKGDDPSGNVRNDLDNTVRNCNDCHLTGYLNAPIAKHSWLPPLHIEKIACQTCHIPERPVKAALAQMSDVYNPGTKISPPGKYIWTFYDQHLNYWNHYGELEMFTAKDQPIDPFTPSLAEYKGKIYPVNMVHSAWPGIYTEGKPGLNQPKMADIYQMWTMYRNDKAVYPELSKITDNNGDSIPEVNSPVEIDAFIQSVTAHLKSKGYDLTGKQIVWVNNDRMYLNGRDYTTLDKETYEASPYASVYKFSHDVAPARAALGRNGCTDCHSFNSAFFFASTLKYPFDENGQPVTEPQYKRLNDSGFMVYAGAFRESLVKPLFYFTLVAFLVFILMNLLTSNLFRNRIISERQQKLVTWLVSLGILGAGIFGYFAGDLGNYMFPTRIFLDSSHFLISAAVLLAGGWFYLKYQLPTTKSFRFGLFSTLILVAILSGILMLVKLDFISILNRLAYTVYDLSLIGILIMNIFYLEKSSAKNEL